MSRLPTEVAPYILSGELYSKGASHQLRPEALGSTLTKDYAQYENYDTFLSPCTVACVLEEFSENYEELLQTEGLLLFILELVILKITAVNIANTAVLSAFQKDPKELDTGVILQITECFSKSLPLWDIRHFRRQTAQAFACQIEEAFKVSGCVAEYEKNRMHLEQIISIRPFRIEYLFALLPHFAILAMGAALWLIFKKRRKT